MECRFKHIFQMENISTFVIMLFVATTGLTIWLFYKATHRSHTVLIAIGAWMLLQSILGIVGFYKNTTALPPRLIFALGPMLLLSVLLLSTTKGKNFIDNLSLKDLTFLHIIRIPVEIILFCMYKAHLVPELMTFEGYNFDIFSGLTAPILYYFVFISKQASHKLLLIWNMACLGLLCNIVTIAILSAPTPLQHLAFEQPNVGILYFPFIWLPSMIVPLVLISHLASIRLLLRKR